MGHRRAPARGDHPLSEPEIDALVRAIAARPNICGYNAFHTSGGVLLRPSSMQADAKLPPLDVWAWKHSSPRSAPALTGYTAHSVFEDFTWDPSVTMSGAADDWMYEHRGVYGWTTEFWDVVQQATGTKQSTHFWYVGPTDDEALAVLRWCDEHHPDGYVDWRPFDHPQLGPIEIGGWDDLTTWTNPPGHLLRDEVTPHADFAIHQALCSPRLEVVHTEVERARRRPLARRGAASRTPAGCPPMSPPTPARRTSCCPSSAELTGDGVAVGGPAPAHSTTSRVGPACGSGAATTAHPTERCSSWTVAGAAGTTAHDPQCTGERAGHGDADVTLA